MTDDIMVINDTCKDTLVDEESQQLMIAETCKDTVVSSQQLMSQPIFAETCKDTVVSQQQLTFAETCKDTVVIQVDTPPPVDDDVMFVTEDAQPVDIKKRAAQDFMGSMPKRLCTVAVDTSSSSSNSSSSGWVDVSQPEDSSSKYAWWLDDYFDKVMGWKWPGIPAGFSIANGNNVRAHGCPEVNPEE